MYSLFWNQSKKNDAVLEVLLNVVGGFSKLVNLKRKKENQFIIANGLQRVVSS